MKHHLSRYLAIFILMLAGTLQAAADLTFSQVASGFPIVGTDANAVFVVDANDAEVVTTAARCVIRDIKAVTGTSLTLRNLTFSPNLPYSLPRPLQRRGEPLREGGGDNSPQFTPPWEGMGEAVILAGTIGSSALIDALIADGKVDTTGLTGVWEAYALQLVQEPMEGVGQALVVMGGTPRGTAYGLFEISRRIGVSPYVWRPTSNPPRWPASMFRATEPTWRNPPSGTADSSSTTKTGRSSHGPSGPSTLHIII